MHCHQAPSDLKDEDRPVILVGNPNVGKSAVFSAFTGRRVDISNYPGTTVELANGRLGVNGYQLTLIDTPGVQSLLPHSDDERVARDVLLRQTPWAVIQVADAKNLRRSLLLTSQLAEHDVPFVMALNMGHRGGRAAVGANSGCGRGEDGGHPGEGVGGTAGEVGRSATGALSNSVRCHD
jgi:ferrous iron transport protein B